ncbi:MAG: CBS domain-containing protein [Deltaproteobacteria bacterium]|nr:CBS domain-containing protein [Deltaproteobacteria bacterium]
MRIGDVMTRSVVNTEPRTSLQEAAQIMRASDVGLLPVYEGGELVGVLTDRDIVVRAVAEGIEPRGKVRDAMTSQIISCYDDLPLYEAARLMGMHAVRRLVVFDRRDRVVGIISIDDLAAFGEPHVAQTLEQISSPSPDGFSG